MHKISENNKVLLYTI